MKGTTQTNIRGQLSFDGILSNMFTSAPQSLQTHDHDKSSKLFEDSLDSEFKKSHGIYYTDTTLAKLILKNIEVSSDATIVDPCCGTGSFLQAASQLGFSNLYGSDFDRDAVMLCRNLTALRDIQQIDSLATPSDQIIKLLGSTERFDVVIGNPPYAPIDKNNAIATKDTTFLHTVKKSGNNLFVAGLYRAFDLAKDDGLISYIVPKSLLHVSSYKLIRMKLLNEKSILSIIDIGSYFKGVRGEQVVITLRNSPPQNQKIRLAKLINDDIVPIIDIDQSTYKNEIILFANKGDIEVYQKLENTYKKLGDVSSGYVGRGRSTSKHAVSGKDIRKFGFKKLSVPKSGNTVFIQNIYSAESGIIASFAGDALEAKETVTVFTDGDAKMCRYIVGLLHSDLSNYYLTKFCFNSSKLTMHADAMYLKKIPLVTKESTFDTIVSKVKQMELAGYMSENWFKLLESLNLLLYKTYGISDREAKHISDELRKIQSSKWDTTNYGQKS